jgi:16S rRNA (guanine966-N2)-methyltransferase
MRRSRPNKHTQVSQSTGKSSHLRIIGGKWRSRKLQFQEAEGLRPTTDRIRETVFNWLSPYIYDARCLDVFSGSGALGLESLSRGASNAIFLEKNKYAAQSIKQNLSLLQANNGQVFHTDSLDWLNMPNGQTFDIVFLDPPFHKGLISPCCQLLEQNGWLEDHAKIYIEMEAGQTINNLPASWCLLKEKQGGQVQFKLYSRGQAVADDSE